LSVCSPMMPLLQASR